MSEKKVGFLTDDKGNPSITRVLSIVVCLTGLAIGVVGAVKGKLDNQLMSCAISFVGMGLGLKAVGKKLEK